MKPHNNVRKLHVGGMSQPSTYDRSILQVASKAEVCHEQAHAELICNRRTQPMYDPTPPGPEQLCVLFDCICVQPCEVIKEDGEDNVFRARVNQRYGVYLEAFAERDVIQE